MRRQRSESTRIEAGVATEFAMCGEIPRSFPVVIKVLRTLRVQGSSTEEVESCVMELMDRQACLVRRSNGV
ncbi:MAG: hypothetical protein RL254_517 [Planctomycetota bacterium]